MKNATHPSCALTFDIEEWFQVENLRAAISKADWAQKPSSVEKNTTLILELLEEENITATFFILGSVAERHPQLIKTVADAGHEVASHGSGHDLTYNLSDQALEEDIYESKQRLEAAAGIEIKGYRAPNFSVDTRLIKVLVKLGFRYDSSYNPFKLNKRYGSISLPEAQSGQVFEISDQFFEIPVSTVDIFSYPFPAAGGAYFRLLPFSIFRHLVKSLLKQKMFYNFYLHPWEFEPDQPKVSGIKLNHRIRHYSGLQHTREKLGRLLSFLRESETRFVTLNDYLSSVVTTEEGSENL